MKLSDIDILSVGNTVQLAGGVWRGGGKMYLAMFPDEHGELFSGQGRVFFSEKDADDPSYTGEDEEEVHVLSMGPGDWQAFLRQTDIMETEVLARAKDGSMVKAILRKSQRQIDQGVSWEVFDRDGYCCRYCGKKGIPLTVDHVVLWEEGGPSTAENLVSACRKCNKTRGNAQYEDWLKSRYYGGLSGGRGPGRSAQNEAVLPTIAGIARRHHVHSR